MKSYLSFLAITCPNLVVEVIFFIFFFKKNCFPRFPPFLLHVAPVSEGSSSDWTDIFQKLDGNSIAVPD